MKLLLAEDDHDVARGVTVLLERSGYTVDSVDNGADALDYLVCGDYDAAILDIMMPRMSGLEVLSEVRRRGLSLPVMMLTAMGDTDDRISGYDAGADDYLPKPFAGRELISRVRALLRRTETYMPDVLTFADVSLDAGTYELSCAGSSVRLPNKAFQVMEMLMRNPHTTTSVDALMAHVWGWDAEAEVGAVFTTISQLRKALSQVGSTTQIRVRRGSGYFLTAGDA